MFWVFSLTFPPPCLMLTTEGVNRPLRVIRRVHCRKIWNDAEKLKRLFLTPIFNKVCVVASLRGTGLLDENIFWSEKQCTAGVKKEKTRTTLVWMCTIGIVQEWCARPSLRRIWISLCWIGVIGLCTAVHCSGAHMNSGAQKRLMNETTVRV